MNETLELIKTRRSARAFLPQQIKEEELQAILEAGIYAPSATNKQPWHFTVVQNKELLDSLSNSFKVLAKASDNEYAKRICEKERFHVFYNAPTVILLSGDETNHTAAIDCAAAAQNMLLQAESLGIGSCWIGFIAYLLNKDEGKEYMKKLETPEGYKQIHAVALGYRKLNTPRALRAPARKENSINYVR